MIQFYAPDIESLGILPTDESQHCIRVLRHKEGDVIRVIDGKGSRYDCTILSADPRGVMLEVMERTEIPPHWGCRITLAVAPTKNMDRMEWLVEKAVELGVDRIMPLLCEHSERKIVKIDRLRKIAVSAMKQSLKTTLPQIDELTPIGGFLAEDDPKAQKFMGYCDRNFPLLSLAREYKAGSDVRIMIGPEGDFSPAEVDMAVRVGYLPVTFGESRLRTETAAFSAIDTIHILNQLR